MSSSELKDILVKTIKSVLNGTAPAPGLTKPLVVFDGPGLEDRKNTGLDHLIIRFGIAENDSGIKNNYWILNCADNEVVSADTLQRFRDYILSFPGDRAKGFFITCRYPYERNAIEYAVRNNIGLARVSPSFFVNKSNEIYDVVYSISPLELKNALCGKEPGDARRQFYAITTRGKIEHLGSLHNYFRRELLNP